MEKYKKIIDELAFPCKCCKKKPKMISMYGELFYAQCNCKKWREEPYKFCGSSAKCAISEWNEYNDSKKVTK